MSLAMNGDVNGDGYSDVVIGANCNSEGGDTAGKVYVLFGKASGWGTNVSLSTADAAYAGETKDYGTGYSVSMVGDVNGDGFDDFLIGAPSYFGSWSTAGRAYLILGKASGWPKDMNLSNAPIQFVGENEGDYAGRQVAGVGDVNGDGLDDFVITSNVNSQGGHYAGKVYLIFGRTGWTGSLRLSAADATFIGQREDNAGNSVSGIGDINGDGFDDFLIGAYCNGDNGDCAGKAYIIFGKASGWSQNFKLANSAASIRGDSADDEFGYGVAGLGDINGDGLGDFAISGLGNKYGGSQSGHIHIFLGKRNGWTSNMSESQANEYYLGEHANDFAGASMSGAGDVNGDGYDDFIIAADMNDDFGTDTGNVYLVLGKPTGWSGHLSLSQVDASFSHKGGGWGTGQAVAGGGDVNGDGFDDIATSADVWYSNGSVYVISPDTNTKLTSTSSVKLYSGSDYSTEIAKAVYNDTVYVELKGSGGNTSRPDVAPVYVTSSKSDPHGFRMNLYETGKNTGVFHGNFTIMGQTRNEARWIKAQPGETVKVTAFQDLTKSATISVVSGLRLYPSKDIVTAQQGVNYSQHYWCANIPSITWTYDSNASWLVWDPSGHYLNGTPDNTDFGDYYVKIKVSDSYGGSDEHDFTVNVKNTPPKILTANVGSILQDKYYLVAYNSTEDGQGVVWHLATNASWLKLDQLKGILSGTPHNAQVGKYYINVSVDDGHGGRDWTNFTLVVVNVNDPPAFTSLPNKIGIVTKEYRYVAQATDPDVKDALTYSLTKRPDGMAINQQTGLVLWTPTEAQVGPQSVILSVSDGTVQINQSFDITVVLNHEPKVRQIGKMTVTMNQAWTVQVKATDEDAGDALSYYLVSPPPGMKISSTGLINWTPGKDQMGDHTVMFNVSDGKTNVTSSFTVTVKKKSNEPVMGVSNMVLVLLIVIIVVIVALGLVLSRRKKTPPAVQAPPLQQQAPQSTEVQQPMAPPQAQYNDQSSYYGSGNYPQYYQEPEQQYNQGQPPMQ